MKGSELNPVRERFELFFSSVFELHIFHSSSYSSYNNFKLPKINLILQILTCKTYDFSKYCVDGFASLSLNVKSQNSISLNRWKPFIRSHFHQIYKYEQINFKSFQFWELFNKPEQFQVEFDWNSTGPWRCNKERVTTQQYQKRVLSWKLRAFVRGKINVILILPIHYYKLIIQIFLIPHKRYLI